MPSSIIIFGSSIDGHFVLEINQSLDHVILNCKVCLIAVPYKICHTFYDFHHGGVKTQALG